MTNFILVLAILTSFYRPGWTDFDKDKLNTRHEVLAESSISTPEVSCNKNRCNVTRGFWVCPYTGVTTNFPLDLDIDHVVPLKNAYDSGARYWSKEKWRRFANDEENLLAVLAAENRSKGHRGPDQWPDEETWRVDRYWCEVYLPLYIRIKQKWDLELINDESKVATQRCEDVDPSEHLTYERKSFEARSLNFPSD